MSAIERKCPACGTEARADAILCPSCKTSFRPSLLGILCIFGLIGACSGLLTGTIALFRLQPLGVIAGALSAWALVLWWRIRWGNYEAWRGMHVLWIVGLVISSLVVIGLFLYARSQAVRDLWEVVELPVYGLGAQVVVVALLWAYFHTAAVRNFCSVKRTWNL